ncbi:MAG: pentapeptide repeat-containing protein [Acidimicrobiales bacterium]
MSRPRRLMARSAVVAAAALLLVLLDRAGASAEPPVISGQEFVRRAAAGEELDLAGFDIEGDVDLVGVRNVKRPLRCTSCRFKGAFRATDVVFERLVDLSGASIGGDVDLTGALFKGPVSLDRVIFGGAVSARSARFVERASFGEADFTRPAVFDRAVFVDGVSFAGGTPNSFRDTASFRNAELGGRSNFDQRHFDGEASFQGAGFGGRASFTLAVFGAGAGFDGCVLEAGAAFRVTRFGGVASFQRCRADAPMDFKGATFAADVSFHSLASPSSLDLSAIHVADGQIDLEELSVADLTMDVGAVDDVRGPSVRENVLAEIEASAQGRGDLITANGARYRFLSLRSRKARGLDRLFDRLLYRGVAGYLVRPLHPLASFGALVVVGGVVRSGWALWPTVAAWARRRANGSARPGVAQQSRRVVLGTQKVVSTILRGLAATVAAAFRRKPEIALDDPERISAYFVAGLKWLEYLAAKGVLAVFVLSLGNSNITVRQLFDAVRG